MHRRLLGALAGIAITMSLTIGLVSPAPAAAPEARAGVSEAVAAKGLFRGVTDVTVEPATAEALDSLGVRLTPFLARVNTDDGLVLGFPIVGNPNDGTIDHIGGIILSSGRTFLVLSGFVIDLERGVLRAKVNLRGSIDLFTIGAATDDGVTLALTDDSAAALNATFGVDAFTEGLVFGYGNPMPR